MPRFAGEQRKHMKKKVGERSKTCHTCLPLPRRQSISRHYRNRYTCVGVHSVTIWTLNSIWEKKLSMVRGVISSLTGLDTVNAVHASSRERREFLETPSESPLILGVCAWMHVGMYTKERVHFQCTFALLCICRASCCPCDIPQRGGEARIDLRSGKCWAHSH